MDILEDAGFVIYTAGSGAEALEKLSQSPVSLVISDLHLPDRSGEELARDIRAAYPAIKILIMSGQQDLESRPLKDLASAILTKPVAPQELVRIIKQTLDH